MPPTADVLAFQALAFIVADDTLRDRFLALSGLDAETLRAQIEVAETQASVLEFLIGHDPDLMSFAEAAGVTPEHIVKSWRALGGGAGQEW